MSSEFKYAVAGGAIAALVLFAVVATVGQVSPFEARGLLQAVLPTIRFLASSTMAAGATILALMLTLLSLTYSSKWDFNEVHFRRIGFISRLATITIILSIAVLLFLGLPVDEAEQLRTYYNVVYYGLTGAASALGGMLTAVVLMLYRTIKGLIAIGHPEGESDLVEPMTSQEPGRR